MRFPLDIRSSATLLGKAFLALVAVLFLHFFLLSKDRVRYRLAVRLGPELASLRVKGRVLDQADRPVAHLALSVVPYFGRYTISSRRSWVPRFFVITDDEGYFTIENPAARAHGFMVYPRRRVSEEGVWYGGWSMYPANFTWTSEETWRLNMGPGGTPPIWQPSQGLTLKCERMCMPGPYIYGSRGNTYLEVGPDSSVVTAMDSCFREINRDAPPGLRIENEAYLALRTPELAPEAIQAHYDFRNKRFVVQLNQQPLLGEGGPGRVRLRLSTNFGLRLDGDQFHPTTKSEIARTLPASLEIGVEEDWWDDCWLVVEIFTNSRALVPVYFVVEGLDAPPHVGAERLRVIRVLPGRSDSGASALAYEKRR